MGCLEYVCENGLCCLAQGMSYKEWRDIILEDVGDAYVFGPAKVISSPKTKRIKPTKEIYDIALRNIQQLALTATREQIYDDRHSDIIKR